MLFHIVVFLILAHHSSIVSPYHLKYKTVNCSPPASEGNTDDGVPQPRLLHGVTVVSYKVL